MAAAMSSTECAEVNVSLDDSSWVVAYDAPGGEAAKYADDDHSVVLVNENLAAHLQKEWTTYTAPRPWRHASPTGRHYSWPDP